MESKLSSVATSQSELYDPIAGEFQPNGGMVVARESHTATLLPDGRVLMVGGFHSPDGGSTLVSLADAEIYDPVTGTFSLTGSLNDARYGHTATLLPSGKVLITGGYSTQQLDDLASAELYDPATGVFTRTGSMSVKDGSVATLLFDGHVLITGDAPTPELYDPATGSFALTGNMLVPTRMAHRHSTERRHCASRWAVITPSESQRFNRRFTIPLTAYSPPDQI